MKVLYTMYNQFKGIPAVFVDGFICAILAFFTTLALSFGGDEAEKYISGLTLYWLKTIVACLCATLNAIQFFRSKSYTDHLIDNKKKDSNITSHETKTTVTDSGSQPTA